MAGKKKISLPAKIIIGLVLGIIWGFVALLFDRGAELTLDFIKPFGSIFIRLLQMIAIPLIIASLITGVAKLKDIAQLSRMGLHTVLLFLFTGVTSIILGLVLVNVFQPGENIPTELRDNLMALYSGSAEQKTEEAEYIKASPLKPLVDIVPANMLAAVSDNGRMLQVVFFSIFLGIALLQVPAEKSKTVVDFFEGLNEVLIKMVGYIMLFAPLGVFALMAALIAETAGDLQLLYSLLLYSFTVISGLLLMFLLIYPTVITVFSNIKYSQFFKAMRPAFLVAFSTSSSSATLPVTLEMVEHKLNVKPQVAGFVLPLGTTVNMDGTALYQAVAAVFIAQALGLELSIWKQLVIVLTATLSAIGAAGVPGAGMITLVIVLESVGVPAAGIALIMAPDRLLDMLRSVVNVSGDAVAAVVINKVENV